MHHAPRIAGLALAIVGMYGCDREPKTPEEIKKEAPVVAKTAPEVAAAAAPASIGTPGESVVADFTQRVNDYVTMRERLDGKLPKLPDKATPRQIDAHQRSLLAAVAKERTAAKQGDMFGADMQTFTRGLVLRVIAGPDGGKIKASLMDENPMGVPLAINARYPDTIPLSTMPPDVLTALPKLPEDIQYRFVGNRLILLDVKAHLIVDFVDNVFDI